MNARVKLSHVLLKYVQLLPSNKNKNNFAKQTNQKEKEIKQERVIDASRHSLKHIWYNRPSINRQQENESTYHSIKKQFHLVMTVTIMKTTEKHRKCWECEKSMKFLIKNKCLYIKMCI